MWLVKPCNTPFRDGQAAWRFYADCWRRGDRKGLELVNVSDLVNPPHQTEMCAVTEKLLNAYRKVVEEPEATSVYGTLRRNFVTKKRRFPWLLCVCLCSALGYWFLAQ